MSISQTPPMVFTDGKCFISCHRLISLTLVVVVVQNKSESNYLCARSFGVDTGILLICLLIFLMDMRTEKKEGWIFFNGY